MFSNTLRASAFLVAASLVGVAAADDVPAGGVAPANYGQYPQLNAPLYPSPVQYTPDWNGGTIITNQALAPHEFLYPHTYHAMYPPFFYKVVGGWIVTPCGVRQHEHWKLQGTEVSVKYRSHYPLFGGYVPPVCR